MAGERKRLKALIVDNAGWGELNRAPFYISPSLFRKLEKKPKRGDQTFISRLQKGRAIRGLKHLLESVRDGRPNGRLVLTDGKTGVKGSDIHVNLNDYTRAGQGRFLSVYRQAGLDVATHFLQQNFPKEFPSPVDKLSSGEIRKARQHADQVIEEISRRRTEKNRLLKKTTDVVRNLRNEEANLKRSIKELEELRRQSSIAFYQERISEFRVRLTKKYPETKGPRSWQAWVYANNWILGVQYQQPLEKEKVGFDSIPDYLFPTIDGFIDILEIKEPEHEVIKADSNHPGSYAWSSECNKAIGQVTNYLYEMELNQLQLRDRINEKYKGVFESEVRVIRPRAFVLIGRSDNWDSKMKDGFRKLNHTLHGVQVLTYSDLLSRGLHLIRMYTRQEGKAT